MHWTALMYAFFSSEDKAALKSGNIDYYLQASWGKETATKAKPVIGSKGMKNAYQLTAALGRLESFKLHGPVSECDNVNKNKSISNNK